MPVKLSIPENFEFKIAKRCVTGCLAGQFVACGFKTLKNERGIRSKDAGQIIATGLVVTGQLVATWRIRDSDNHLFFAIALNFDCGFKKQSPKHLKALKKFIPVHFLTD